MPPGQCLKGIVTSSDLGTPHGGEKGETEDRFPQSLSCRGNQGKKSTVGHGWGGSSSWLCSLGPRGADCPQRFARGGSSRFDPRKLQGTPPTLYTGRGKFTNCFRLPTCPLTGGTLFSALPTQQARPDGLAFGLSSLASFSPSGQKPGTATSREIWAGGTSGQRGLEEEGALSLC